MCKKKILMIHNFYQISGGEDTVFKNEVEMLRKNGHEVIEYTRSNDELKESKIKLLLLPFTTIWSWKTYREIKRIIKKQNIDIVHCHNTFPMISPSVYYAAWNQKIPVVQTIHNFRFLCPCGTFYRDGKICEECRIKGTFKPALKNKCYRNSMVQTLVVSMMLSIHRKLGTYKRVNYIFLTEFNKQRFNQLIDINRENVFVKPNFVKKPVELKFPSKISTSLSFVFAGRLEESKGIKYLLEQWKKMPENYQLHIYGEGSLAQLVKEKIQDSNNIQYLGVQPQNIIFEDILRSKAVLITSECYETFGMLIAESFSLATPVVCTDLGNPKLMIEESNGGITYKIDDDNSFCEAIQEVVVNNELYKNNAFAYYEEKLSDEKNYTRLSEIYDKVKLI